MISVVLYGRNDSHGYNLHKRAAISLNCIAAVLSHCEDEIIFVDCNTPDDMPTFPEAIQDTLTPQAKGLLRILRLRPALYEANKRGSHLQALEPLSRNAAVRRSNPANRWILSTNTDMVFVPRAPGESLSDVAETLPDGFYELPRFEVPETLWESVNRMDPAAILAAFDRWGRRLHLNEVIVSEPHIRFDGPGDFQLMLRQQIFAVDGFHEAMVLGWHVDSNLCKRMYLLNGRTDSLLDRVFSFHCDHTRQATLVHRHDRKENDQVRFIRDVTSPSLPDQREVWGLPQAPLEEIRLTEQHLGRYVQALEPLVPGLAVAMTEDVMTHATYNHGLLYDTLHALPYVSDHLVTLPPTSDVGYAGGNADLLRLVAEFRRGYGHTGAIYVDQELLLKANPQGAPWMPRECVPSDREQLLRQAAVLLFDGSLHGFPCTTNAAGVSVPEPSTAAAAYAHALFEAFLAAARDEQRRRQAGAGLPRKFLLIGSQHTWLEAATSQLIGVVPTVYSTRVRHGYLREDAFTRPIAPPPLHTLCVGATPEEWRAALSRDLGRAVSEGEYGAAEAQVSRIILAANAPEEFVRMAERLRLTDVDLSLMRLHREVAEIEGRKEHAELFRVLLSILERLHPWVRGRGARKSGRAPARRRPAQEAESPPEDALQPAAARRGEGRFHA
jgi:hypothetical protein